MHTLVPQLPLRQIPSCAHRLGGLKSSTRTEYPRPATVQHICQWSFHCTIPQSYSSQSFVDDTKLYLSFQLKNKPQSVAEINQDLVLFRNWCLNNFLLLNAGKSKLMVFGSGQMVSKLQDFSVNLLGEALVQVESAKDLGLTLDGNLTYLRRTYS